MEGVHMVGAQDKTLKVFAHVTPLAALCRAQGQACVGKGGGVVQEIVWVCALRGHLHAIKTER
jgi:hypothetical protein